MSDNTFIDTTTAAASENTAPSLPVVPALQSPFEEFTQAQYVEPVPPANAAFNAAADAEHTHAAAIGSDEADQHPLREAQPTYEEVARVMGVLPEAAETQEYSLSDPQVSIHLSDSPFTQEDGIAVDAAGLSDAAFKEYDTSQVFVAGAGATSGVDLSRLGLNQHFRIKEMVKNAGGDAPAQQPHPKPGKPPKNKSKAARTVNPSQLHGDETPPPEQERLSRFYLQSQRGQEYLKQAMETAVKREDGVDHINISIDAQRGLGKALEMNAHTPFTHPELGQFASVGGFWYYVGGATQDENFRLLHGYNCLHYARNIKMREVEGFHTIIAEATWIKMLCNTRLANALRDCNLPLESYTYKAGRHEGDPRIPTPTTLGQWYVPVMDSIRQALRELQHDPDGEVYPDFSFLDTKRRR